MAVLGKQGRVLGVAAGIGERRRRRGGPFIAGLGRWCGGGRWPASQVLRRPLMACLCRDAACGGGVGAEAVVEHVGERCWHSGGASGEAGHGERRGGRTWARAG